MATNPQGKVRFRRAAIPGLTALAATGALVVLTAQGALGVQFSISGLPFKVTASHLHGVGFEQFGAIDYTAPNSPNLKNLDGQALVFTSAIGTATITNLCQSINLGGINMVIKAGGVAGSPVTADHLVLDSDQLSGDVADFKNIEIGNDASKLDKIKSPDITGPLGDFGQQADQVDIDNVVQNNWAATAATFHLPNLTMGFSTKACGQ